MQDCVKFYIDGRWVDPVETRTMDRVNPATEETTGQVALGSAADVDRAVRAAKVAFETYQYSSRKDRIALFDRIIDSFENRRADIGRAISADLGTPAWFANGYQTQMALDHFIEARRLLVDYPFEYRLGDSLVRREAFGVCGLITAWNWPVMLVTAKVAPALAAGCTVILKPSEFSPQSARVLTEILDAAGISPGVFNLVLGDGPGVGAAISSHPDIDLVSFTGSKRAGVAITQAAAETVKMVHLELGGKSANIILPDTDLATAVADGVRRAFINSGQSCIAPTRMLVHEDQLVDAERVAGETASAIVVGRDENVPGTLGPVANAAQFERVQGFIQSGIDAGAKLVAGGPGHPEGVDSGYYIKPTVFSRVMSDMAIAREEIFGPVLSILAYSDDADAVRIANDTTYGLAGYVSSADRNRAVCVANQMKAGRVFINGAPQTPLAPFGGYKQSGNGREWGIFGLEAFLEVKAIID